MSDGNLRQLFRKHLPEVHWLNVETWSTGRGVPDLNYCYAGAEGWLELKATGSDRVSISAEQIGWAERRCRAGGRVSLAVRRVAIAGPQREPRDELWLFDGQQMRELLQAKVTEQPLYRYRGDGGPAHWDWMQVLEILTV